MRVFEFEFELKMMVEEVVSGMEYFDRCVLFLVILSGLVDVNDGNDYSFLVYVGFVVCVSMCCC